MLGAGVLLVGAAGWTYAQDLLHRRALLAREGSHLVSLEREFLSREMQAVRTDLLFLAQQPQLQRLAAGYESARAALEAEFARFARSKPLYDQIRYLDASGQEVVRINRLGAEIEVVGGGQLQQKAGRYYFQEARRLAAGQVFVSPFDLNVEHGVIERPIKPVIRLLTPVLDTEGRPRGLLALNYAGARILDELREISAAFRGHALLVNLDGEYLRTPDRLHEWGWQLGHGRSFRGDHPAAWEQLRTLETGQIQVDGDLFTVQRVLPAAPSTPETSALLIVSHIPAGVAESLSRPLAGQLLVMLLGSLSGAAVLAFFWARASVARRVQEHRIGESEARLRLLSSRLLAAQEEERRSLSRLLHDELGQRVTALSLDVKTLLRREPAEGAGPLLRRAAEEADGVLAALHAIATRVRPSVLDDLGLRDAIESHVSEYQDRTGISVDCDLRFERQAFPGPVAENVYRIVQEALANVAAHAQADAVRVQLVVREDRLELCVEDRGCGFDPGVLATTPRLGVLGMRERVELLGGEFQLDTERGRGTTIRVRLPLPG
jgi:signal transduction histidine kinase